MATTTMERLEELRAELARHRSRSPIRTRDALSERLDAIRDGLDVDAEAARREALTVYGANAAVGWDSRLTDVYLRFLAARDPEFWAWLADGIGEAEGLHDFTAAEHRAESDRLRREIETLEAKIDLDAVQGELRAVRARHKQAAARLEGAAS